MVFCFGIYELDEERRELCRGGENNHLEPQVFDVLAHLIRHRDRVVTRIELLDEVWGSRYVGEAALTSRIKTARQAVGDSGREQAVIRTVHGRGFRFVAPVSEQQLRRGAERSRLAPEPATMAGRAAQLARLEAAVGSVVDGLRSTVFVTGEAGIGKTTLVDAFLERLEDLDALVGRGQCLEQRAGGEAYLGVFDALGRLCRQPGGEREADVLAAAAPTWLLQMPSLVRSEQLTELQVRSLGATRERMLRELVDALEALAADRPVVIVVEDLHWSDDATADLLDWLARRRDPARLLVLGTYRPDTLKGAHRIAVVARELLAAGYAEEVRLDRLDRPEAASLLEAWFPGLPADVAALVHSRTDGVPLFMRDVVASWTDSGVLVADDEWRWAVVGDLDDLARTVPESAQVLVERELAQLGTVEVELLEAAAVAGVEFASAAVAAATGATEDETEQVCTRLARRGLLLAPRGAETWGDGTMSARFGFLHQLHHRVVYDHVPPGRRGRLHRAIGERLEAGYGAPVAEHVGELALHFDRGGDGARAAEYLRRTAEQAIGRGAHREAVAHLNTALEHLSRMTDGPERLRAELLVQTILATALIATLGWAAPQVEAAYRQARELCRRLGDPPERYLVLYGLATVHELRGRYQQSEALLEQQLADGPTDLEIETFELLACSTFHQGGFDKAVDYALRGLDLYDHNVHSAHLARYGEHPGVSCTAWAALALWFLGRPSESLSRIEQALELGADHPYALTTARIQAAFLHQYRDEPDQVRRWADATIQLASEQGFPFRVAQGRILRGWALAAGGAEEGLRELRAGLDDYRSTGAAMDWPYLLGLLADALLRVDRAPESLTQLDDALALVEATRAFFHEPELHRLRGGALLAIHGAACLDDVRSALRRGMQAADRQRSVAARLRLLITSHEVERQHGEGSETGLLAATLAGFSADDQAPDLSRARALLAGVSR
jgi:DNA-binding winged helix-turn-helix (wHTH) protein/tetratricopeptide (TPR) repeat protein